MILIEIVFNLNSIQGYLKLLELNLIWIVVISNSSMLIAFAWNVNIIYVVVGTCHASCFWYFDIWISGKRGMYDVELYFFQQKSTNLEQKYDALKSKMDKRVQESDSEKKKRPRLPG